MVKLGTAAKIIRKPDSEGSVYSPMTPETDLFAEKELFGVKKGKYIKKSRNRVLADIEEMTRENRWEDVISLYHPAEEKIPELVQAGMGPVGQGKGSLCPRTDPGGSYCSCP